MDVSRRRFLDAAVVLTALSPLPTAAAEDRRGDEDAPMDAVAMAQAVREGRTSALILVDAAIRRLEAVNPEIDCVAFPHFERARRQARAGVTGPLAGVPTLIKDNTAEKALPNTNGLKMYLGAIADHDDPYVAAIQGAGLISIGRSTLPEFASNLTTESALTGATRNPWNLDYTSGGSSGGSAAAVAAGVTPIAHGNDAAGSIRHAAAPCGLVGLKPSRGRNAGDEASHDISQQMVHGPLSRTVRDTAAWFAATESQSPTAPFKPVGVVSGPLARKLRSGVRQALPHSGAKPAPAVQAVFEASAALLGRLGHEVSEAPLAYDGPVAVPAYMDLWEGRMARFLASLEQQAGRKFTPGDIEPRLLSMAQRGKDVSEARMAECLDLLRVAAARHASQFDAFEVYMTPVFATEPIRIGELGPGGAWDDQRPRLMDYACYCWIDNLAGTPAISLPMGFSPHGLPIGIQFSAAPGGERVLLELAYQLEREVGWGRKRPPVWAA